MLRILFGTANLGLAAICGWAWYDRYWQWRNCFNELGRCWDSDSQSVYVEQSGMIWGAGAAGFFVMAIVLFGEALKRMHK
jgi:hypothetical protein